ncbi:MAG TPA: amidohydrolase family protein [Terriglobales bacterium]|nr:amidohydrolase family protein [Terriglobales bacterium]
MKIVSLVCVLAVLTTFGFAQGAAPAKQDHVTVIRAGTLIDGISSEPRANQYIVVRNNRIESVSGDAPNLPNAELIDLSHATILPGLTDAHTHMFLQGEDPALGGYDVQLLQFSQSYRAARATVSARRALEQGFTTIRDLETEGAGYGDLGIKRAVNEGWIPGPRIFGVGRAISTTGGYPLEGYAPEIQDALPKGVQMIDGPVEARKAAREQLSNGVDWIKVYMTHRSWIDRKGNFVTQPTLTVEELKAIVDEAHGWRKKVACHAYSGEGLQRALDGGCDSIEHGLDISDAQIAQMLRQGTWYCPTLSVYYYDWAPANTADGKRDRARADLHGKSFSRALKAGVKIVFGTDIGGIPWSDPIAQEFARMVEFGMTPMQAIQSATLRSAELLDMQGDIGAVAPGDYADIVAVSGDPLKDVNVLKNVGFVMKDGKVFKNELNEVPK